MAAPSGNMVVVTNQQFWLLTLGLIVVWALVIASAEPANHAKSMANTLQQPDTYTYNAEKERKHGRSCKALCEHCGCLGFYCGEECICECNNENSDTECIAVMQRNARKLAIPFEILIQGPTANHFVRNAQQFEQNTGRRSPASEQRSKRSTVTIYKPTHRNSLDAADSVALKAASDVVGVRHKRAVSQLDWFTDLANTLVRPAPLGTAAQRKEESADATARAEESTPTSMKSPKRGGDELDRSWFTDSTKLLLRPAPLFKRSRSDAGQDDEESSKERPAAMRAVEKIPQVLKKTLRNIQESALVEDFTDVMRNTLKDGTDVFQNNLQTNLDFLSPNLGSDISDVMSKLKFAGGNSELAVLAPPVDTQPRAADSQPKYIIPWFRPVRFLRRVQQAIN